MLASSGIDWPNLANVAAPNVGDKNIGQLISIVLPYIFLIAGLLMVFYLIYAGYKYMFSGGEPKQLEEARRNMTYAIVGFLVVFASYWIVSFFGKILNLPPFMQMFAP